MKPTEPFRALETASHSPRPTQSDKFFVSHQRRLQAAGGLNSLFPHFSQWLKALFQKLRRFVCLLLVQIRTNCDFLSHPIHVSLPFQA